MKKFILIVISILSLARFDAISSITTSSTVKTTTTSTPAKATTTSTPIEIKTSTTTNAPANYGNPCGCVGFDCGITGSPNSKSDCWYNCCWMTIS